MSKLKLSRIKTLVEPSGFVLPKPEVQRFRFIDGFQNALAEQKENTALVDGEHLSFIDIDGKVDGTDWRMSFAAFSDLCYWTKTPVAFVKRLAKIDEALALDVVRTMIEKMFKRGPEKMLVVDAKQNLINGIVGKDSYSSLANAHVLDYAMSSDTEMEFCEGWLAGPNMRFTTTTPKTVAEPNVGDIVNIGMSLESSINGDSSVKVSDFAFRLKCTNGLTARDSQHTERILHRGDVEFNVQQAVVCSAARASQLKPMMDAAAKNFLGPEGVATIRQFISNPKNGGSPSLDVKVVKNAMLEAKDEGRPEEEVTVWNFVNGVTQAAHDTKSLDRRLELEAVGYRTLAKFGFSVGSN
jgi:hypothetical protein